MAGSNRTLKNRGVYIGVLMFTVALSFCAYAEIYKWTDENGKVHYGDRPPADANSKDISDVEKRINTESDGDRFKRKYRKKYPTPLVFNGQSKQKKLKEDEIARRKQVACQREKDRLAELLSSPPYLEGDRYAKGTLRVYKIQIGNQRKKIMEVCD